MQRSEELGWATYHFQYMDPDDIFNHWEVVVEAEAYTPERLEVHMFSDREAEKAGILIENFAQWLEDKFEATPVESTIRPAGRPTDPWNEKAILSLIAGADEATVRAQWEKDYAANTLDDPRNSADGLNKTWNKRVMKPYRERKRGMN